MATKLQSLLSAPRRVVEPHDVFAAFQRAARARWGERVPLEPVRYARATLTVACPSPLWRTELLFSARGLQEQLQHELPTLQVGRISAILK